MKMEILEFDIGTMGNSNKSPLICKKIDVSPPSFVSIKTIWIIKENKKLLECKMFHLIKRNRMQRSMSSWNSFVWIDKSKSFGKPDGMWN